MTAGTRSLVVVLAVIGLLFALIFATHPWLARSVVTFAFAGQVIRIAVPYALAALGGSITERAGVIDLALEAKLLFGAFAAAAFAYATGNLYVGIAGGMLAGVAVAAVQLACALGWRADQVIVGIALNVLALGGTRFLLQLLYGQGSNSPVGGPAFGDAMLTNPLVWLAIVAPVVVALALVRTRWGLRLRAAGDRPDALVSVGVSPARARTWAALVGGALAGAGGAQLSLSVGVFSADMSGGRGYFALAMVIIAGWRPHFGALACIGIATASALDTQLQLAGSWIPRDLIPILPHVLVLVVLAVTGRSSRPPPRSLGRI
ncbi:MAG TPA: hypothetical protein VFQ53_24270 [Kofleriaceae bacterium]|nr:hypothetical protein [Kofleriaceae bacterium]